MVPDEVRNTREGVSGLVAFGLRDDRPHGAAARSSPLRTPRHPPTPTVSITHPYRPPPKKAGLIRGYHAVLDARAAGLDIGAFIGVGIDHPRSIAGFEKAIRAMPEVLEVHHVTGRHTLLVKIRTENTASLHRLIEALRELPGVARTETMVVLDTLVERQRIELPAPASETPRRRKARPEPASTQEPRATRAHRPRE